MAPLDALPELPVWLLVGVGLGVLFSGVVALAFYVGLRRYPDAPSNGAGSDGGDRRREEIRRYLEAIGEPYQENAEVAGATVAFYLPERAVAITFDARAFFRIREAGGTAVLAEHELPGANLGARLPFETPTFGRDEHDATADRRVGPERRRRAARRASTDRGGSAGGAAAGRRLRSEEREATRRRRAAFAALGLPPDADEEAVEAAFRRRVKQAHPDHGGDSAQFRRVREAYEVASEHAD